MKKIFLLLMFACAAGLTVSAQDSTFEDKPSRAERREAKRQKVAELIRQSEEGVLVFRKHNMFGIQLRTNGYGAFYEHGRMISTRKTNIFRIDIQEVKHPKEEKLINTNLFFGNPFVYGKLNSFYPISLGYGQQYIFGQKGNKNGVSVSGIYSGGINIGLLRPYYIDVVKNGEQVAIKYTTEDSTLFLADPVTGGTTLGGTGFFGKGWGELKVKPGVFGKAALRFDYGRFNERVSALEVGMSLDYYFSKIPMMFANKERQMFFQGYLAIVFGNRK